MTTEPPPDVVIATLLDADPSAAMLGIEVVSVAHDAAVLQLTVRPEMCNGVGMCHGGLIFALADTAIAYAANSINQATVVASAQIEFLTPAEAGVTLTAAAARRWAHQRSALWDVTVTDSEHRTIAVAHGRTRSLGTAIVQ